VNTPGLFYWSVHMYAKKLIRSAKRTASQSISITSLSPRNPVVMAMSRRASSQGAGRHAPSRSGQRRAEKVALLDALKRESS
jgi:hypothetical protein